MQRGNFTIFEKHEGWQIERKTFGIMIIRQMSQNYLDLKTKNMSIKNLMSAVKHRDAAEPGQVAIVENA